MTRDSRYDIAKGLAIILMVVGHTACPRPLHDFIYVFHMPVFFIAAGWFYRTPEDAAGAAMSVWKRIRRLWWPFAFWSVLFICLHNLFLDVGIYTTEHYLDSTFARQGLFRVWSLRETADMALKALVFKAGGVGMGAPYWFFPVMFYATVLYMLADFSMFKARLPHRLAVLTLAALLLVVLAKYTDARFVNSIAKRTAGRVTFTAILLFHLGVLLRRGDLRVERLPARLQAAVGCACAVALVGLSRLGTLELVENMFPSVTFLLSGSLSGWYLLCALGGARGPLGAALACVGRHTMPILLLHLFGLKAATALGVWIFGDPSYLIAKPIVAYEGPVAVLVYTAFGVGLPLAADGIARLAWAKAARLVRGAGA